MRPSDRDPKAASASDTTTPAAVLVLLIAMSAGCGSDRAGASTRVTRTDSSGVEIVQVSAPVWESDSASRWQIEGTPAVEIGGSEGDTTQQLYRVAGVHILQDGTVAVADGGFLQVRFYSPDGEFRNVVGRRGDGPGEFRTIRGFFGCPADSLIIENFSTLEVLNRDGSYVRSEPVAGRLQERNLALEGISANCEAVLTRVIYRDALARVSLFWADRATASRDSITSITAIPIIERQGVPVALPFGSWASWSVAGDGVFVTDGDTEIRYYGRNSGLIRIIRWTADRDPVTAADRARFEEFRDRRLRENPRRNDIPSDNEFSFPAEKPAVSGMISDEVGNLWLRSYPDDSPGYVNQIIQGPHRPPETWTVVDSSGVVLGNVAIPQGLQVLEVQRDFVIGIYRDELDVQSVRLHRIIKPSAGPAR